MLMQAAPPRTFTVYEEDDGWDTIQDAQNAAAIFALISVRPLSHEWHETLQQDMLPVMYNGKHFDLNFMSLQPERKFCRHGVGSFVKLREQGDDHGQTLGEQLRCLHHSTYR